MFKHIKMLVIAAIIFLSVFEAAPHLIPTVQATGSNVVQNPGFESSSAWTADNYGGYAMVSDSTYSHTGGYSGLTTTKSPRFTYCVASLYQDLNIPARNLWNFSYWIRKGSSATYGYDVGEVRISLSGGYSLIYYHGFDGSSAPNGTSYTKYIDVGNPSTNVWQQISRNLLNDLRAEFEGSILMQNVTRIGLNSYGFRIGSCKFGQRVNWDDIQMTGIEQRTWTFMVYLDADCGYIGASHFWDLNLMEEVGSTEEIAVVVQIDYRFSPAERRFILKDNDTDEVTSPILANVGEVNMGNPDTLINFTTWVRNNFPASNYALILWDHGKGWQGVCIDDTSSGDWMNTTELGIALSATKTQFGKKVDLIGFMACEMQMAEVAYQIRDYCNLMVASQEVIYVLCRWPFNTILANLTNAPNSSAVQLGQYIIDGYAVAVEEYKSEGNAIGPVTTSMINLTRMDFLASDLHDYAECMIQEMNDDHGLAFEIIMCADEAQSYPDHPDHIDLYDFAELTTDLENAHITGNATNVLTSINQTVIDEWHGAGWPPGPTQITDSHGVSIFFCESIDLEELMPLYYLLDFADDTDWDEFIDECWDLQTS